MFDSGQMLLFIDQVMHDPVWIGGALLGALSFILLAIYLLRGMLEDVRKQYWR